MLTKPTSVCIAGILRTYYTLAVTDSQDVTWGGYNLWTWEGVEVNLGISCACAPAIKPLLLRWFPRIMESVFGHTSSNRSGRNGLSAGNNGTFIPMNSPKSGPNGHIHKEVVYGWRAEEATHVPGRSNGEGFAIREGGSEESLTKSSFSIVTNGNKRV